MKGHSHASPDRSALYSAEGIRAIKISTFGLLFTAVLQISIVAIGGSVGLLADSLHNFGDVFTTVILWIAFNASKRAADERYTYGYDRFEDLVGIVIVLIIGLSAVVAGYESTKALLHPGRVGALGVSIGAGVVGIIGNELVARYKIRAGRKINSVALEADGFHSRTDGLVSAGAVAGLVGVALGFPVADALAGMGITLAIVWVMIKSAQDVVGRIVDKVSPDLVGSIRSSALRVEEVQDVHDVRARWAGRSLLVEMHIALPEEMSLLQAHGIGERVSDRVFHEVDGVARVLVHVDPAHPGKEHRDYHEPTSDHLHEGH